MENMNKNKCHCVLDTESHRVLKRQKGEMLNQVQHDVFFYKGAFTLIELLVVVLIIGILAAVALPQYEQSVMRGRFATLKANATAIYKAQLVYYMANGEYSDDMEALSIDLADCTLSDDKKKCTFSWGKCEMITDNSENGSGRVSCYNTQTLKNGYAWYWKSPYYGPEACWVFSSDLNDKYHKLCEREGGTNLIQTTCGAAPLNVCHIYKLGS